MCQGGLGDWIQIGLCRLAWIPAFAGMTRFNLRATRATEVDCLGLPAFAGMTRYGRELNDTPLYFAIGWHSNAFN